MLDTTCNNIDLWLVDEREIDDQGLLDNYHDLLSEEELTRHQRFIFPKHRHQFLVARALVRTVLAEYLDQLEPSSLTFTQNNSGKPELTLQSPVQFNLSHTNGLIALAVTQNNAIGIDVEYLSRKADIASLAERYFSKAESEAMLALPVEQWNERFFDLWTLKEAFLKACGTGLRTPLHEFSFSFTSDAIAISFSSILKEEPLNWQFWQLQINEGFRVSLAVHDVNNEEYQLNIRQGIPLQGFSTISPPLLRKTVR